MDLKELSKRFDEAIVKETKESLTQWLNEQRKKIHTEEIKHLPCRKCSNCMVNYDAKYEYDKHICKLSGNYITDIYSWNCEKFDEL